MNPRNRVIDCPACDGTGKVEAMKCEPKGDCHPYKTECDRCEGVGQIITKD
ncbi:MAG TPA: hypothetical protein PLP63_06635 [Saprospiraceae bacterium]|nr:hypothetical protein [Saprospiraceae bacterium]